MTDFPFSTFAKEISLSGLLIMGEFQDDDGQWGILIGNTGGSLWSNFSSSPEFKEGHDDRLDCWTQRIVEQAIGEHSVEVRYPFGSRVWPFQKWAALATGMQPSPIGLYIHSQFGLWVGLRAAVMVGQLSKNAHGIEKSHQHPCDSCVEKPCLNTCPVNAFLPGEYKFDDCREYLLAPPKPLCRSKGCLARLACPVGQEYQYGDAQQAFHTDAFAQN